MSHHSWTDAQFHAMCLSQGAAGLAGTMNERAAKEEKKAMALAKNKVGTSTPQHKKPTHPSVLEGCVKTA